MKRKDENLKEKILLEAKDIIDHNGIDSLNMRDIASRLDIAVGTLYNYYQNKDDILLDIMISHWLNIYEEIKLINEDSFISELELIYDHLRSSISLEIRTLLHYLNNDKDEMFIMQKTFENDILNRINKDINIKDVFNESFTKEDLANFIMNNLYHSLKRNKDIHVLIYMIAKIIY